VLKSVSIYGYVKTMKFTSTAVVLCLLASSLTAEELASTLEEKASQMMKNGTKNKLDRYKKRCCYKKKRPNYPCYDRKKDPVHQAYFVEPEGKCDIVMANASPRIFGSSCFSQVPFDWNGLQNTFYKGMNNSKMTGECVLHSQLSLSQLGPMTRRPNPSGVTDANRDFITRHGYIGGWYGDWISEAWPAVTDASNNAYTDFTNANREFVNVDFPCTVNLETLRISGVKESEVGDMTPGASTNA